jgi:SAM-dependent methyltransferase
MNNKKPIALDAYEELADSYAADIETKPHNAYYDRPAILSLLPDLKGKSVLDAGCGPGVYAEIFLNQGARVVAIDASPKMVALTKKRVGNKCEVREVDLNKRLSFLADASFDVIVSPLVLGYLNDLKSVYQEFYRVLRPSGYFVFSESHPFFDMMHFKPENYFSTELVGENWNGFGKKVFMSFYRRPLGDIVNPLIEAGFILEKILEPLPTEDFKQAAPKDYEALSKRPGFICFKARK